MPKRALLNAKAAQEAALKKSVEAQKQQAQAGLQSTEAKYTQAYQQTANQYNQAFDSAKNQYTKAYESALSEYAAKDVNIQQQAEDTARQAYLQKMEGMKVAPNVLQQAGLASQGYAESTLAGIGNAYKRTWSDTMQTKDKNLSEVDRLRGLASTEKQFGLSEAEADRQFGLSAAEAERQFGLSQAQAQLQQNNLALEGQLGAGLLDIEAQYQKDLANYLASMQQLAAQQRAAAASKQKEDEKVDYKNASSYDIERGLAQIKFDPRVNDISGLTSYLEKYVKAGAITKEQGDLMLNRLAKNYQPTAQNVSNPSKKQTYLPFNKNLYDK